jgi:subtilisin family serine protease
MTPELQATLALTGPAEKVPVVATLRDQVDPTAYTNRRAALERALRREAAGSEVAAEALIEDDAQHFWLVNALAVDVTPGEAAILADDPDVASVDLDSPVKVTAAPQPFPDAAGGNWGVKAIDAPSAWSTYGVTGAGVKVGSIDTGVEPNNPDLAGKIVGWRDFVGGQPNPYDDNGHGTHTVGTMVGGSAGGAPVGVAPGATVIVAKAMNAGGTGQGSTLLAAAQWMADPDGNPATADHPAVINNSWSASGPNDPWFRPMIQKWLSLGIVPVFAAGNSGPTAGTIGSPASYPEALAVGATAEDTTIAAFSARGPVVWQNLDGLGPAAGTPLTKPDVVAPGVGITATVGSGWLTYSGTSMASPHVAGIVALVKQANPALGGQALADVIRRTASDLGPAGGDPVFGSGLVSASAAVASVMGPAPETAFTVLPPALTNQKTVLYGISLTGASSFRFRVDSGTWSAPVAGTEMGLTLSEGKHLVEAQAIDARGIVDASPAAQTVTVDTVAPRATIEWRLAGSRVVYTARVTDATSGVDATSALWRFSDGSTVAGLRTNRPVGFSTPSDVSHVVRDRAGNESTSVTVKQAGRSPISAVDASRRVSRRGGAVVVRGRLARSARVIANLQPLANAQTATADGSGAPPNPRAGAVRRYHSGAFEIRVPLKGVAPGTYRVVLSATGSNGLPLGRSIVRRVKVTA